KAKAAVERAAFPHSWVDHPAFDSDVRTTASGTLNITDGSSVAGAWIGLVEEDGDDLYWGQTIKGYQYWTQVAPDGSFTIEDVRGGSRSYTLYAHVDGVMDEYKQASIIIPAGGKNLGTINWTPVKHGKTIWQIGYPDRSAKEYRNGSDLSQWGLWLKFPTDFPNGVNYIIGQSNEATDWNYAHCAVGWTEPYRDCLPDQFTMPDWTITFDFDGDSSYAPKAYLTLATVSCSLTEGEFFRVLLNGTEIAVYEGALEGSPLGLSGAMARTSHYGGVDYRQNVIEFDLSLLQPTNNVITLRSDGDRLDEIMYDCIRLEIRNKSDINADGKVNLADLSTVAKDWKNCTNPADPDCVNMK
ncbi:MAG: polysaccharide lyase family protein, partial [Planctomycetota bacterium]